MIGWDRIRQDKTGQDEIGLRQDKIGQARTELKISPNRSGSPGCEEFEIQILRFKTSQSYRPLRTPPTLAGSRKRPARHAWQAVASPPGNKLPSPHPLCWDFTTIVILFPVVRGFAVFHPVLSYPVLSYPILSCPVLRSPVLSCPVLSCPILSYPILSYPILSYPILFFSFLFSLQNNHKPF